MALAGGLKKTKKICNGYATGLFGVFRPACFVEVRESVDHIRGESLEKWGKG